MHRGFPVWLLLVVILAASVVHSPAPLIFTPGEGWTYEPVGSGGGWKRTTAKDQLAVAQVALETGNTGEAIRAAKRVVSAFPLSDYAPEAQLLLARAYQARGDDQKAFKAYQDLIEKFPTHADYEQVARRQYEIANKFLAGKWFKLWGFIPAFPSMDKTAKMYKQIVENGPYSDVAPAAQFRVGVALEKKKAYEDAVKAYEKGADRYYDDPEYGSASLYRAGMVYNKRSDKAEYDQTMSLQAIAVLEDFITLYPSDPRAGEAEKVIDDLKTERARGRFMVAEFYEKRKRWAGALIYYNEVLLTDPTSEYSDLARERIDRLKKKVDNALH